MKSRFLAIAAGCLGAAASATGKLAMDGELILKLCQFITSKFQNIAGNELDPLTDEEVYMTLVASLIFRGIFLLSTLMLNGVMWSLFAESMQGLNSGEAVVLNTGANILVSAFLGRLVFGEMFGMIWWLGASFILCGMSLLHSSTMQVSSEDKRRTE